MKSTIIAGIAAASVIATGMVASLDQSSGAVATASSRAGSTTYAAHDMRGNLAMADIAEPHGAGPDIGDVLAFTQRLTRHGHTVGRIRNAAIGVDHQQHLFQSNGTMSLDGGDITFSGLVSQTPHFVLAVTGGTGDYRGATGTLSFRFQGKKQLVTLSLDR